jgi:hypothetical protein
VIPVVTPIEVLSPSDKKTGNSERAEFLEKQREALESDTHLVEIDLLRGGTRTAAVPREPVKARAGRFDHFVSIHLFDRPKDFLVYPRARPS